ncbi:plasmid mobilization relaxosome protein MobC (plasmid) [Acinetobacter haemolyticus]|nr:plasmid mobilization relaxosome protein MobC [Acinetobacter haemolyticus]
MSIVYQVKTSCFLSTHQSLREYDYNILNEIAKNTDTSINYYIIRLILNNIYSKNVKLLGTEIEQLRKSNYEIHKIGVNINQIAKNLNTANSDTNNKDLASFYLELDKTLKQHLEKIRVILESSLTKY